jgi:hypothetical protein
MWAAAEAKFMEFAIWSEKRELPQDRRETVRKSGRAESGQREFLSITPP